MAYVYRHIRLDKNVPFYIGIGSDANYLRANETRNRNKRWRGVASKSSYLVEIMVDGITYEEAKKKEIEFIELYGRADLGKGTLTNLTNGGDGASGALFTEERKQRISKALTGKPVSEEHLKKIVSRMRSDRHPSLGKKRSEEVRAVLSQKAMGNKKGLGRKMTEENKAKLIECNKKRVWTEEAKMNMRIKKTGLKHSEETRKKMAESQAKRRLNEQKK